MHLGTKTKKGDALPEGWRRVRLDAVASVKTGPFGAQLHQHDYVQSNGTPIVTVEHLSERGLIHKNLPLVSYDDKQRLSQYLIQEGDIVFSRVGSVDRSALVSKDEDGWLFSGRLLRVRPERNGVNSSYLNFFFHTRKFRHHMKSIAVGGTMPSINTSILSNVIIHLPSVDEQKSISSLLETWDTAIEKTEALIAAKEKQFKWLLKTLISDQQDNPEWRKVKLGDVCEKIVGGGTPSTANSDYWQGHIPWITSADIASYKTIKYRKYITAQALDNSATNLIPKNNIIVVTRVGLGKAVRNDIDVCISQDSQGLILKKSIHPDFLINFLIEKIKIFKSASQGSTIKGITKRQLADIKIPLPSLPEQKVIASLLEKAQEEIDILKQLAEQYRTQKRGLIQKLLTGRWLLK